MLNSHPSLEEGYKQARLITKKYAKTFYLASLFLGPRKRYASYAIYSLCRLSDESVDGEPGSSTHNLNRIEEDIEKAYSADEINRPLLCAFRKTVTDYAIPKEYFLDLIHGMYMDTDLTRYQDFSDLYKYCYKVAGVVGLIMLKVFGCRDLKAELYAVDLGVAMQLTNILRDIREDYARGRIYLPRDECVSFGVSENHFAKGIVDEHFKNLLRFQVERARKSYQKSQKGIALLSDSRCRFVVSCMSKMYCAILGKIEKMDYDVFSRRAQLSLGDKFKHILGVILEKLKR